MYNCVYRTGCSAQAEEIFYHVNPTKQALFNQSIISNVLNTLFNQFKFEIIYLVTLSYFPSRLNACSRSSKSPKMFIQKMSADGMCMLESPEVLAPYPCSRPSN